MGLLDVNTNYVAEYIGRPQEFPLGEMTRGLVSQDFWQNLLGSRRDSDLLTDLKARMGGQIWMTGSVVREVWPGYPSTEAERELPKMMDPNVVSTVKRVVFGGELEMGKLTPAQYLGVRLATYACLPQNIDFRANKTEYGEDEAWDVIDLLTGRFASRMGGGWYGSVIESGGTKELVFANDHEEVAAVCFYFKDKERSGGGMLNTQQWESGLNSRELQRRVEISRNMEGRIVGISPGMLGRKSEIFYQNPGSIVYTGQRMEQLARAMREITMTGRTPSQLMVESFGEVSKLEDRWNLRQWMMCLGNMALAMVQDPVEMREMLKMIGVDINDGQDCGDWREVLAQADDVLIGIGRNVHDSGSGMKIADLAPLVGMLTPKGFGVKEVLAMVPEPDLREKVVKVL